MSELEISGGAGKVVVHRREPAGSPRLVVLLVHGYAEHFGRYAHVIDRLATDGAVVYAPDHRGHGRSDGEQAVVHDIDDLTADLGLVADFARDEHPDLPVVMVGHSMGGAVATRYAQLHPGELAGLVLSAPVIGGNPAFEPLLGMDPMPDVPLDPVMLSRDPAVGEAYVADELVYSGPLKRPTLAAILSTRDTVAAGPTLGSLPVLWVQGELDPLAPLVPTQAAVERVGGDRLTSKIYPGAMHEIFNETNKAEVLDDVAAFVDEVVPRS